jgi:hypothetical protein
MRCIVVVSLLKKGLTANSLTSWTRLSVLQLACMNGHTEIASALSEFGSARVTRSAPPLRHPQDPQAKRCVAYSGILLREQRKNRNKKRSTLIDIGAEDDEDGLNSIKRAAAAANNPRGSPPADNSVGDAMDPDAKLYPHLLIEALNVLPLLAHTTEVLEFLLERMLVKIHRRSSN